MDNSVSNSRKFRRRLLNRRYLMQDSKAKGRGQQISLDMPAKLFKHKAGGRSWHKFCQNVPQLIDHLFKV